MEKWPFNGFFTQPQLQRYAQFIPPRTSCRTFTAAPDFNQWSALSFAAGRVCLPGVRIVLAHCDESFFTSPFFSLGRIAGAQRFAALLVDHSYPNALCHCGISGEAFVLEALSAGVSSCWVTGTYRKKENPVQPRKNEQVAAVIALGIGKEIITQPPKRKKGLFNRGDKKDTSQWPSAVIQAAAFINSAPSAMNKKPWTYDFSNNAFTLTSKERLDLGIALLHSEAAFSKLSRTWGYTPVEKGLETTCTFTAFT